jgi:hypothetical protein
MYHAAIVQPVEYFCEIKFIIYGQFFCALNFVGNNVLINRNARHFRK